MTRAHPPKSTKSTTSLHAFRTRKEAALARLRELEVAEREGRLLPADAVEARWREILARLRAAILAVPARLRAQRPHLAPDDLEALDRELRAALAALADGGDAG